MENEFISDLQIGPSGACRHLAPLLAKQTLPPQITQAIKSWQQRTAAVHEAERQINADKEAAGEECFASCPAQFETVFARAIKNGLKPKDVRAALAKSKAALKST